MITLTFIDGECEYDNHIIIFFETLKNHVEDFGVSAKIDLTGIEIKKEEFDHVLNMCEGFIENNKITEIINNERQSKIEDYLGLLLEHKGCMGLTAYCAIFGLLDILKNAHIKGCKMDTLECQLAAQYGHLECLKYAHENGCLLLSESSFGIGEENACVRAIVGGHYECLKYAHEHGCPIERGFIGIIPEGICSEYVKSLPLIARKRNSSQENYKKLFFGGISKYS